MRPPLRAGQRAHGPATHPTLFVGAPGLATAPPASRAWGEQAARFARPGAAAQARIGPACTAGAAHQGGCGSGAAAAPHELDELEAGQVEVHDVVAAGGPDQAGRVLAQQRHSLAHGARHEVPPHRLPHGQRGGGGRAARVRPARRAPRRPAARLCSPSPAWAQLSPCARGWARGAGARGGSPARRLASTAR
jgi:hypothetical protein